MFEIIISDDFMFDSDGNYTCGIWCETSSGSFPGVDWTDFAGIMILNWSREVMSACRFQNMHFKLLFMDGPYEIVGHRVNNLVKLDFYRNGSHHRILEQTELVEIKELSKAMYQAVMRLWKALYLNGYEHVDLDGELRKLIVVWKRILT